MHKPLGARRKLSKNSSIEPASISVGSKKLESPKSLVLAAAASQAELIFK